MQLLDVCKLIVDCEHKTAPLQEDGYPSIRTPNVGRGRLILDGVNRVSEETYRAWTGRAIPEENDLILAREAPAGNVAIIKGNLKVCLGQRTVLIRPNRDLIDPDYLVYLLLDNKMQNKLLSYGAGVTVPHINMADIRKLPLPVLPDMETQTRIGRLLSSYDDLIQNNVRRIKILEEMAQRIYREWFVNFRFPGHEKVLMVASSLGEIPEGWEIKKVSEVATVIKGRGYKGTELSENGGVPFVNLKCINRDGGFRSDGLKRYTGKFKNDQAVNFGSIVMAVTDMTQERRIVARAARVPSLGNEVGVISMDLVKIQPSSDIASDYLYGLFRFSDFPDHVKQYANGANVLHLNPERIEEFRFSLAPKSLRNQYRDLATPFYNQCDILMRENDNLETTRNLLLPKLISGELDVSELDIEVPAEAK